MRYYYDNIIKKNYSLKRNRASAKFFYQYRLYFMWQRFKISIQAQTVKSSSRYSAAQKDEYLWIVCYMKVGRFYTW